jgi:uncharacterized membrane protein
MIVLSEQDKRQVADAVREAERATNAEICVHVVPFCPGDALKAARREFARLGLHKTRGRNAVLIYAALASKKFAVFGDEAVDRASGRTLWEEAASVMGKHFSEGRPGQALAAGVRRVGEDLAKWFPASGENPNELPDGISEG